MAKYLLTTYKYVYDKNLLKLKKLYDENYSWDKEFTPEYRFSCVLRYGDIWFHLVNELDEIIACCSVECLSNNSYEINDVLVEEKFKGNNYGVLLLCNVINELDCANLKVKLFTSVDNYPAIKTYEKIFGYPNKIIGNRVEFCI